MSGHGLLAVDVRALSAFYNRVEGKPARGPRSAVGERLVLTRDTFVPPRAQEVVLDEGVELRAGGTIGAGVFVQLLQVAAVLQHAFQSAGVDHQGALILRFMYDSVERFPRRHYHRRFFAAYAAVLAPPI